MSVQFQKFDLSFDPIKMTCAIAVPMGSEILADRINPQDSPENINLWLLVDPEITDTYDRTFMLIGDDVDLPASYKKYFTTFRDDAGAPLHLIEI